jgi:hypothetical protein
MKIQRTVFDTNTAKEIPVTVDLNVKPLFYQKKPVVNGNGKHKMDDEWMYVNCKGYGNIAINVNRANFCKKVYLSQVNIIDSIGGEKVTERLQKFINKVSEKLVFTYNGTAYQVFLNYNKKKKIFDIDHVWPYWANVCTGGIMPSWDSNIKKYGSHPGWDYEMNPDGTRGKHKMNVDLEALFGI